MVHGTSAHPLYAQSLSVEQVYGVMQSLTDVLPAGDHVPEGQGVQVVAPADDE